MPAKRTKRKRARPQPEPEENDIEIISPADLAPGTAGLVVVLGPYGFGKSTLLGMMMEEALAEGHKALLIATRKREVSSWYYQKLIREYPDTFDAVPLLDEDWQPAKGKYDADAFLKYLDVCDMLADDDEYRAVAIDSGTHLMKSAWHECLKPYRVGDPGELGQGDNRFGPYGSLAGKMEQAILALDPLKDAPLPKIVGIAWHSQPAKDETLQVLSDGNTKITQKKPSADQKAEGIEYGGNVLPMILGRYRRELGNDVDVVVWADILYERQAKKSGSTSREKRPRYVLQVVSDEDRQCKVPGPLPNNKYIDNDWQELKKLLV